MDDRTRRAIGIIAAIAFFGGIAGGLAAWFYLPHEEPAGTPAWLPPPAEPRLEPDVIQHSEDRAAGRRQILEQLDAILRDAEALQREVYELGEAQQRNDALERELERKIERLEQRR